jgi:hypothetical protein
MTIDGGISGGRGLLRGAIVTPDHDLRSRFRCQIPRTGERRHGTPHGIERADLGRQIQHASGEASDPIRRGANLMRVFDDQCCLL